MLKLNEEQKRFVESDSPKICCIAGAGSGKTASLIQRVGRLVEVKKVRADNILVLTFTNAAAFEMRERYMQQFKTADSAQPVFKTFHAFCYSLITSDAKLRNKLGYVYPPQIILPDQDKQLQNKVKAKIGCKLSDKQLTGHCALQGNDLYMHNLYKKALYKAYRENNVISFDYLGNAVCELFTSDDPVTVRYKKQYQYILVDEFQDTSPDQWEFVKSFKNSDLCCIGDCLQTLYAFRGCTPEILKGLSVDPEWEVIKLPKNYRSTKQIVDFANNMSTYADESYRVSMFAERPGDKVTVAHCLEPDKYDEVNAGVKNSIADIIRDFEGSTAILCRTNAEVKEMTQFLRGTGVDVSTSRPNEEAEHILKSLTDIDYHTSWLSTFVPNDSLLNFERAVTLKEISQRSEEYLATLVTFLKDTGSFAYSLHAKILKVKSILNDTSVSAQDRLVRVAQLLRLKHSEEDKPEVDPDATREDLLNELLDLASKTVESDVYVGTIHSSKGLEYDTVILVGVNSRKFRLNCEDMLNLYYVGITRAKNKLIVCYTD